MLDGLLKKEDILELIKNDDTSVRFAKPTTTSSMVWQKFSHIYVNNKKQNFASCDTCKDILHYKSTDGTSSMMKHLRSCESNSKDNNNKTLSINEYFSSHKTKSVPPRFKNKVLNATIELVAMDNRAFELIAGNGFINFTQTVFDVGQLLKSQNVDACDLLPHPTTVSKCSSELYELLRVYANTSLFKLKLPHLFLLIFLGKPKYRPTIY